MRALYTFLTIALAVLLLPAVATAEFGERWEQSCSGATCLVRVYSLPTFFLDEGNWVRIDETIGSDGCDPGYAFCTSEKAPLRAHFRNDLRDGGPLLRAGGTVSFNLTAVNGQPPSPTAATTEANTITYAAVAPGVDVRYTFLPDRVKEDLIVANASADLEVEFRLSAANLSVVGDLIVVTPGGPGFTLLPPFAEDSAGNTQAVDLTVLPQGNALLLRFTVPASWLTDPETVYPVTIDPTVLLGAANISLDAFVDNNTNTTAYARTELPATLRIGHLLSASRNDFYRSAIEFAIGNIPQNALIERLNLSIYVSQVGALSNQNVTVFDMDQLVGSYPNTNGECQGNCLLWKDMGNGTEFNNTLLQTIRREAIDLQGAVLTFQGLVSADSATFPIGIASLLGENDTIPIIQDTQAAGKSNADSTKRPILEVTYSMPLPQISVASPANQSIFKRYVPIPFNLTAADNENFTQRLEVFASNETPGSEDLIYQNSSVPNNTISTFSWTAPVLRADGRTLLLAHFDNRSAFRENDTHVVDFSVPQNNGTVNNSRFVHAGKIAGAYEADGSFDSLSFGSPGGMVGTSHSYLFWAKPASLGATQPILSNFDPGGPNGLQIQQDQADLAILLDSNTPILTVPGFFQTDVFIHLAVIVNTTDVAVYRNGTLNATAPLISVTDTAEELLVAKGMTEAGTVFWNGTIDELVIMNRTLSAAEVADRVSLRPDHYFWYANATDLAAANQTDTYELYVNSLPQVEPQAPTNGSVFHAVSTIILTSTLSDSELQNLTVQVYGSTGTPGADDVVFIGPVANGTNATYNWTAPVLEPDGNYLMLVHLDNNSAFGENSTVVFDFAGSAQNGSIMGDAFINLTGFLGGALSIRDSTDDRIRFGDQDSWIGKKNITYLAWLNAYDVDGNEGIIDKQAGSIATTGFRIAKSARNIDVLINGTVRATATIFFDVINQWSHLAVVLTEDGNITIYKNGERTATGNFPSMNANNNHFVIGNMQNVGGNYVLAFNGSIDEVAVINTSLTAEEVLDAFRLRDGTYTWYANASDGLEENQSVAWQFTIDRYLDRALVAPVDPKNVVQNGLFTVNATVVCLSETCQIVRGAVRYNASSAFPDTNISTSPGATPFVVVGSANPQACPDNPLAQGEYCNLTWSVNATGALGLTHEIGVLFTSNQTGMEGNATANSTVEIVDCIISLAPQFPAISFGTVVPGTADIPGEGNDGQYNLTTGGDNTCAVDLYVKGLDLQHTDSTYAIGIDNLTWSNMTTAATSASIQEAYTLVNASVTNGTNTTLFFWLDIPQGILSGLYNATVTFTAVKEGSPP